jgi:peroxin-4
MKRLLQELKELRKQKNSDITLEPVSDSLLKWSATMKGVGPFADGVFELELSLTTKYPQEPPQIRFKTPICHPNINFKTGEICLDLLKENWSPSYQLYSTLMAVQSLLQEPEPSSPLNCDAANLLRTGDFRAYNSLVRMYTHLYAKVTV